MGFEKKLFQNVPFDFSLTAAQFLLYYYLQPATEYVFMASYMLSTCYTLSRIVMWGHKFCTPNGRK